MSSQESRLNADSNPASRSFDELIALADEQYSLYQQTSDNATFELAMCHYSAAFDLGPSPDSKVDYVLSYFRFRHTILLRAQSQGSDGATTTRYIDRAVEFTPATHPLRPVILGIQAASYMQRYRRTMNIEDLHLVVQIDRTVTDTISEAHPQRRQLLMQYGLALHTRFIALQDENDLILAIQQFRTVLEGCPEPLLMLARRSLAFALDTRYKLRYDIDDIDLAVDAYADVVDMLQQQPKEYIFACMGYAVVLRVRFYRKGNIDDIHIAIKYFEVVIGRCPPGHQHYFAALTFYATLLICRCGQEGSLQDIDKAIECIHTGMKATGHANNPTRPEFASILGRCQLFRYLRGGVVTDLESAVENCYAAVSSDSSFDAGPRAANLNRLGLALFTRYQLQGDTTDATRAKTYLQQALDLCPLGNDIRPSILNNAARIFGILAMKSSKISESDLEFSVKHFFEALDLCYEIDRSVVLCNLTFAFLNRYSLHRDPADAELAFSSSKRSLELQPESHPFRGVTLLFQAKAVIAMFLSKPTIVDTEIALDVLHAAQDAFPTGHPMLIETYRELSKVHFTRHSLTNSNADLEEAFKYRIAATEYSNGGSRVQFEAAMQWVEEAEKYDHPSLLNAYKSAIRNLDSHLMLKPSLELRHGIIKTHALKICMDATSCALRRHDVVGAVEVSEHSRGLFWTYMSRLRTPLDELRESGPSGRDLADEFESLSRQLETPMTLGSDGGDHGQRFRRLQRDWNTVVDKIRAVDSFGRFLLPPSFEDLRVAAKEGPVIILNASRHSCDAIIVLADAEPIHVPFKEGTSSDVVTLSSNFDRARWQGSNERELVTLLRDLWTTIVSEVVRKLEPHVPQNSRIWWCPIGDFTSLPIHAAHPYCRGENGLLDVYVPSYTPTLSALIRSRNKRNTEQSVPSFVAIGQPDAPGYDSLPSVTQELDMVQQLLRESVQFTKLSDKAATREAALAALRTHTFAHLACHGEQVFEWPFESHFAMRDDGMTLLDILHSQRGHDTEFAFLSVCETATGDAKAPDEVIHLAAALQFAGIPNVVGTTWSVDDEAVIHIVKAFYRAMVREDGVFDSSRAAQALRTAIRTTRAVVPLDQQIVFIHIGV